VAQKPTPQIYRNPNTVGVIHHSIGERGLLAFTKRTPKRHLEKISLEDWKE
jgi:hypothetical protein